MSSATETSSKGELPSQGSSPPTSPAGEDSDYEAKVEEEAKRENAARQESSRNSKQETQPSDDNFLKLTGLLNQSQLFTSILADKMREQQRHNAEQARREAAKNKKKEDDKEKGPTRKSTRTQQMQDDVKEEADVEPSPSKRGKGRPKRVVPKKEKGKDIANALNKQGIDLDTEGPSVQEALAEAAAQYEDNPEGLGAQDLVATEQPKLVTGGKMRQYQLEGLEWLKTLWMNGLNGILADQMGLGKTIQTISLIAWFKENNMPGPFLIACPLSTVRNWIEEFKKWTPDIKTVLYHGSKPDRQEMKRKRMKKINQREYDFPVVVTSYEICMNDKKELGDYDWKYIIVDEGHRLKNMNCRLIKDLMTYQSANRLLITGTPLQNNIAELWSLLHFLLPDVFTDLNTFEKWFDFSEVLQDKAEADSETEKKKHNLVSTMHAILKPFLLRRVKTDVETTLPKKREYILYAPLTEEQKELYREIKAGTGRQYLEEKAVDRIEARSRTQSLKRKANGSGRATPAKSIKSTRESTPASVASTGSTRRGRKVARRDYGEIGDREFNARLRRIEQGEDETLNTNDFSSPPPADSSSEEEHRRAQTLKLAKAEIASKKLQNPIMQLRLACNSPHNFYWPFATSDEDIETYPTPDSTLISASGKMLLLDTLLPYLFKLNHKVLIFSQFKTTLDILETYATTLRNYKCCRIDGSIGQDDRYDQITAFNTDPSFKLFLLSTRAGGQGINLTAADTVILFDSDWNPQQDLQAMDRAHRIGQTRPVIVYRLATRGTVEEDLLFRADAKRKLEKLVIQKGKFRSLFEGVDSKSRNGKLTSMGMGEVSEALGLDEFEKYDLELYEGGKVLSEQELRILTDRSDKAYERAEQGRDVEGKGFRVAKTSADNDVLEDFTVKGAKHTGD